MSQKTDCILAGYRGSRRAYEQAYGPIPKGMCVCHTCDEPHCINPEHLWLGTHADNIQDAIRKGRHRSSENWRRLRHGKEFAQARLYAGRSANLRVLRLQLSYLSKDQALAVADTILRTFKGARLSIRQNR
jgi:hypothetical protein